MPLESEAPRRVAGRLRHLGPLFDPEALLEPITADELAQWEAAPLLPGGSPPGRSGVNTTNGYLLDSHGLLW